MICSLCVIILAQATAMYIVEPAKRPRRYTAEEIQNIDDPEELYSILKSFAEDGDMLVSRWDHDEQNMSYFFF